jgi:PAS domain S-box-containing protein
VSSPGRHKHLARQLRKLDLTPDAPPSLEAWTTFLNGVSLTYEEIDRERYTLERSVGLFEREMTELHAKIEAERDRMRVLVEAAPTGIMRVELDGSVSVVNPAFERILGYSAAEMGHLKANDLVHPDDRPAAEEQMCALRESRTRGYSVQRRYIHKNGSVVHTIVAVSAVVDKAQRVLFKIGVIEDISERTRLELELRNAQRLESVGRLASGIAHEINTPIQFIGDYVSFLRGAFTDLMTVCDVYRDACARLGDALPPELALALRAAEESADLEYLRERAPPAFVATLGGIQRVSTIVKAMKSFGHPDQGEKSDADINAALDSTITVSANELKYVAEVETDFGDLPAVPCYLGDLNQVFLNLLVNGAHAIADAGASGEAGLGKIRVETRREDDFVVVRISDTGTGIPPAVRHRIFDPFFTTKEVGRGTGQGLAIARAVVVEKHGGTLTFETETGKGTTFIVRLPLG